MRILSSISLSLLLAAAACGGSDGDDGLSQLVDVGNEPAGDNCANGGTKITSGTDDDGDGTLDAEEVETTEYVCDPDEGGAHDVLVGLADAGGNCPSGGTAVSTGVDDDDDGILDAEEIDSTSYVCDGAAGSGTLTAEGTVVISDPLQLALLGGFDVVEGDLRFSGGNLPADIDLPNLVTIGGDLELASQVVETVTLDSVESIGGLLIGPNTDATALTSFSLASLAGSVAGDIDVGPAPALATLDLGGVTDVGGTVTINFCDLLTAVDLSLLATVGGDLQFGSNPELLAVALPVLTDVTGSFSVFSSAKVATFTLPLLDTVGGSFLVSDSTATDLSAVLLASVGGNFTIEENNLLTTLGFDVLATITGPDLFIRNNDVLPCTEVDEIIDDFTLNEDATGNENGATDCNPPPV